MWILYYLPCFGVFFLKRQDWNAGGGGFTHSREANVKKKILLVFITDLVTVLETVCIYKVILMISRFS